MSDTQLEAQPAPEAAPASRSRWKAPAVQPPADATPEVEPAAEASASPPAADVAAPVPPVADVAQPSAPVAETPPATTPRATATAISVPWDSALPGVTSADIRAELDRRQRRAKALLAERERLIREMEAIEAALDAIGE